MREAGGIRTILYASPLLNKEGEGGGYLYFYSFPNVLVGNEEDFQVPI